MNHPSWWDPMTGLALSTLWPDQARHYAPMDGAGLAKYPFLERLGFFAIEPECFRGGLTFLRRSLSALEGADGVLWVTAQGRFVDPRERPTRIKPGVAHLARRLGSGQVLPLALEYPFWNERTPEALVRFGAPIGIEAGAPVDANVWTERIERALNDTQDALAEDALSRDPDRFETLLSGGSGVGGAYDVWRRAKSVLTGRRFDPRHGS